MKRCKQCLKLRRESKFGESGYCVDCEKRLTKIESNRLWLNSQDDYANQLRDANEFVLSLTAKIRAATQTAVILPSWGFARITRIEDACHDALALLEKRSTYLLFYQAVELQCTKTAYGYDFPALNRRLVDLYSSTIDAAFADCANTIRRIQTDCVLAKAKAYDYSEIYRVVGVTFKNGRRHRQTILRQIRFHDAPYNKPPTFRLEKYKYEDEDAVAVYANEEQVGNISRTDLPWLLEHWNDYSHVDEYDVHGGGEFNYGLTIRVCFANSNDDIISKSATVLPIVINAGLWKCPVCGKQFMPRKNCWSCGAQLEQPV